MQRHTIDIGEPRAIRIEVGSAAKLGERLIGLLEPNQSKTKRMVQSAIARRQADCGAQNFFALCFPPRLPVQIGKIDRGRKILRTQSKRCFILCFGFSDLSAPGEKGAERRTRLRPVGIELLSRDKFRRRAFETPAVLFGQTGERRLGQ